MKDTSHLGTSIVLTGRLPIPVHDHINLLWSSKALTASQENIGSVLDLLNIMLNIRVCIDRYLSVLRLLRLSSKSLNCSHKHIGKNNNHICIGFYILIPFSLNVCMYLFYPMKQLLCEVHKN